MPQQTGRRISLIFSLLAGNLAVAAWVTPIGNVLQRLLRCAVAAARQQRKQSVDMRDAQIAGIVLARHATLATRNVQQFVDLKISVVDPWAH